MKPGLVKTYLNQPSYCGQKLRVRCEVLSPVCREYTLDPESPIYSYFNGCFGLIDIIIVVFAIGSKLPISSLLSAATMTTPPPSSSSLKETIADKATTRSSNNNLQQQPQKVDSNLLFNDDSNNNNFVSFVSAGLTNLIAFIFMAITKAKENPLFTALIVILIVRTVYRIITRVPAERLTVIRGVGLQLNKQNFFGQWGATELVDVATITNLIINESFFRHRVVYYLAAACQDRPVLVLPFPNTLPQLVVLRTILRGVRAVLYNEVEEGLSLADIERIELEKKEEDERKRRRRSLGKANDSEQEEEDENSDGEEESE